MSDEPKDIDWSLIFKDLKDPGFIKGGKNPFAPNPSAFPYKPLDLSERAAQVGSPLKDAVRRIDVEAHPDFQGLNVLQRSGAKWATTALQLAVGMDYIDPARVKRIMDFGAGGGGPTFGLVRIGEAIGAEVEAVEQNAQLGGEISETGILPQERVHIGDGLAFLNGVQKDETGYDLVTAFMLGPDLSGDLMRRLAQASGKALKDGGNLVVTSDGGTFSVAKRLFDETGLQTHFIHGINEGNTIVPNTLIIPKASCQSL